MSGSKNTCNPRTMYLCCRRPRSSFGYSFAGKADETLFAKNLRTSHSSPGRGEVVRGENVLSIFPMLKETQHSS